MAVPVKAPEPSGADLHIHTTWSDGLATPAEVVARARGSLALISICDHDTLSAYDDLPEPASVAVIAGIEISVTWRNDEMHLLGYFPAGITPSLRREVARLEEDRRGRIRTGVERLREDGFGLRWSLLADVVGGGVPCRSHVARALAALGYGRSPHALVRRHLGRTRFPLPRTRLDEAVTWIRDAQGYAVWAHPREEHVTAWLPELARAGLHGLEVFTPRRRRGETGRLLAAARRHGLFATGGSDDHGTAGRRLGEFRVDLAHLPAELRAAAATPSSRA